MRCEGRGGTTDWFYVPLGDDGVVAMSVRFAWSVSRRKNLILDRVARERGTMCIWIWQIADQADD